jgi:hypothetical protein
MPDPANISVSETLRSGQDVEIRSQRQQDRKALEAALARMSDESLRRRFFGAKRHFSEKEAEHFLDIDFVNLSLWLRWQTKMETPRSSAPGATLSFNLGRLRWRSASSINFRAKLTLGENATLVLDEFVYDPFRSRAELSLRVIKGPFL